MPFTRTPILYGFVLKTEYIYILSDCLEKINTYYCGYDKLQAIIYKIFPPDKYRDGWTTVNLATSILILYYIQLAFTVLSIRKAGFNIIIIRVKDPN